MGGDTLVILCPVDRELTSIDVLVDSRYDEVVELIDKDEFTAAPLDAYENKIFCKGAPLKTGVIWNKEFIEEDK